MCVRLLLYSLWQFSKLQALVAELEAARSELAAARTARAALSVGSPRVRRCFGRKNPKKVLRGRFKKIQRLKALYREVYLENETVFKHCEAQHYSTEESRRRFSPYGTPKLCHRCRDRGLVRLEEYSSEIRRLSHSNATLQAKHIM